MAWPRRLDHGRRNHYQNPSTGVYIARIQRWWRKVLPLVAPSSEPLPPPLLLAWTRAGEVFRRQRREMRERERDRINSLWEGSTLFHERHRRLLHDGSGSRVGVSTLASVMDVPSHERATQARWVVLQDTINYFRSELLWSHGVE